MNRASPYILLLFILLSILACRKDTLITDSSAKLGLSEDTLLFDTVFTSVGSVTKQMKIYNTQKGKIKISSIRFGKGNSSYFRMNVDGQAGKSFSDIEIPAGDSLFIFVEVTIDPNKQNSPLVVTDSIVFVTNGNIQDVKLVAWGQDAHYIVADQYKKNLPPYSIICSGNTVRWRNDKPYVIYGYGVIDSYGKLIIDAGVKIYFHKNGGLWVYKDGNIEVNGNKNSPVTFQGDRLEHGFSEIPGQWDRIWLNEGSKNNVFNYAIIKNGFIGIQAETLEKQGRNFLLMNNTIIRNMSGIGIYTRFYKIKATNTVIANCGNYNLALTLGGSYHFRHCTFANYWNNSNRQTPLMIINNYSEVQTLPLDNAYFGNCIIYGNLQKEIELDFKPGTANYVFDHSIVRLDAAVSMTPPHFIKCSQNNPAFADPNLQKYELTTGSAAIDEGDPLISNTVPVIQNDIIGNSRIIGTAPDLGAYEFK
jgi:hypothetical protein